MTGTYFIGTNYDATSHSVGFWVVFLTVASVAVVAMMALFLYAVARASQATRPAADAAAADSSLAAVTAGSVETAEAPGLTAASPVPGGGVLPAH